MCGAVEGGGCNHIHGKDWARPVSKTYGGEEPRRSDHFSRAPRQVPQSLEGLAQAHCSVLPTRPAGLQGSHGRSAVDGERWRQDPRDRWFQKHYITAAISAPPTYVPSLLSPAGSPHHPLLPLPPPQPFHPRTAHRGSCITTHRPGTDRHLPASVFSPGFPFLPNACHLLLHDPFPLNPNCSLRKPTKPHPTITSPLFTLFTPRTF